MSLPVVQLCLIIPFFKNKNQHRKHSLLRFWWRTSVLLFPQALINTRPWLQYEFNMSLSPSLPWALSFAPYLSLRFSSVAWLEELEESGRNRCRIMGIFSLLIPRGHRPFSHARTLGSCCHEQVDGLEHKCCLQSKVYITYLESGRVSCSQSNVMFGISSSFEVRGMCRHFLILIVSLHCAVVKLGGRRASV